MTYSQPTIEVVGKTDRDSNVFLNGQKIDVNPDGTFVTRVDLTEGLNSLNFLAVNQLGRETTILRTVLVKKEEFVMGENVKDIKVEVLASNGSSSLNVEVDGSKAFEGTILEGTTSVFEASSSIKLKAGNAGAISLKLNGEDIGLFGEEGEQKEQEFK